MNTKQLHALQTVLEYLSDEKAHFDNLNDAGDDPGEANLHIWIALSILHDYVDGITSFKSSAAIVPKFSLGQIVATAGALEVLSAAEQTPGEFLNRHLSGDWGELDREDIEENESSLKNGYRLLSAYRTKKGEKLWIITEHDRSATTLLLPSEY
jgi:hypothetical protein